MPLVYRYLLTLIIKLSPYYIKLQYNPIAVVNVSLLIYPLYVTRLVTLTNLLRV